MATRVDLSGICQKCHKNLDDHAWAQVPRADLTWLWYCPTKRPRRTRKVRDA